MENHENLSVEELKEKIKEKKQMLLELRFSAVSNELKDNSQLKKTKKDVARILTCINQKGA